MRPTLRVAESDLRALTERLLVAAGASEENAHEAAEIFVDADVKGIGAQGIDYMYYIIDSLKRGLIDGRVRPPPPRSHYQPRHYLSCQIQSREKPE